MRAYRSISKAICITFGLLTIEQTADAGTFPAAAEDQAGISSFGYTTVFIRVDKAFQPFIQAQINSMPGYSYDPKTGMLRTPGAYDPAVRFGFSGSLTVGSNAATNGVKVGVASPTTVKANSFTTIPTGFTGAKGTDEIFDKITTMDMQGKNVEILAGTAAGDRPNSIGIIQSLSDSGKAANDFPAKSFFDIFVDIKLDFNNGQTPATLNNSDKTPFVVQSTSLTQLPPFAIPLFGHSTGVPIFFQGNVDSIAVKGDRFGIAYLAGPFNGPNVPEPASITLLAVGGLALAAYARRPPQAVRPRRKMGSK
jgi:hypothetical protein